MIFPSENEQENDDYIVSLKFGLQIVLSTADANCFNSVCFSLDFPSLSATFFAVIMTEESSMWGRVTAKFLVSAPCELEFSIFAIFKIGVFRTFCKNRIPCHRISKAHACIACTANGMNAHTICRMHCYWSNATTAVSMLLSILHCLPFAFIHDSQGHNNNDATFGFGVCLFCLSLSVVGIDSKSM